MEFRILGPLEVSHDGRPVRIRGRHHPKVLALLLTEANRVVGVGRIIELLWDVEPPQTATRQVQNIVAGLRRQLGEYAPPLEAVGTGYRLTVDSDRLDATMFESRVREATRLARAGGPAAAFDGMTAALGLWRGRALADLSANGLDPIVERLEDSRLAAVETHVDIALELDRGAEFIAHLRELLDANPYRQRLAARLMLVLHRDGRTAEALEAFTKVRLRLAEDLGVSPSRELSQTHSAILRDEPEPGAPPVEEKASRDTPAVPAQLPFSGARFVGRDTELDRLDGLVDAGAEAVVVSGPAGIGKTAMVLHWAQLHRDRFPDGQLYVNLRGFGRAEPLTPLTALHGFLRALGVSAVAVPDSVTEASAVFRSKLDGRRFLIVVDNARDADQVRPLLPGGGRNQVLVTSRNRLTGLVAVDGARSVPLRPLSSVESMALLRRLIGQERFLRDRVAVDRLAELCGHLPLALRIAAANLAARANEEIGDFVVELESQDRLELLAVDGDDDATVASAFESSYLSLSEAGRRVFVWMGAMPGEYFAADQLAAVADVPAGDARRALSELNQAHLVEPHRGSWHRMHDLVRLYAKQKADELVGHDEHDLIRERLYDWYFIDSRTTIDPVDFENLVPTYRHYRHHPDVWRLCGAFKSAMNFGFGIEESRRCAEDALALAQERGDALAQAHMWDLWGMTEWATGRHPEAIRAAETATRFAEDANDDTARRLTASAMGLLLYNDGRYREAEPHVRRALELLGPDGQLGARANATNRLSGISRGLGRYDEAVAHARTAMELAAGTIHADTVGRLSLAKALSDKGELREALREIDEGLSRMADGRHPRARALFQCERADVLRRLGQPAEAVQVLQQLESVDGTRRRHARHIDELLPVALVDAGRLDEARRRISASAERHADDTGGLGYGIALSTAIVFNAAGEHTRALQAAERAHDGYLSQSAPLRQARSLAVMAAAHRGIGDDRAAVRCRAEADAIFQRIGAAEVATDDGSRAVSRAGEKADEAVEI